MTDRGGRPSKGTSKDGRLGANKGKGGTAKPSSGKGKGK